MSVRGHDARRLSVEVYDCPQPLTWADPQPVVAKASRSRVVAHDVGGDDCLKDLTQVAGHLGMSGVDMTPRRGRQDDRAAVSCLCLRDDARGHVRLGRAWPVATS